MDTTLSPTTPEPDLRPARSRWQWVPLVLALLWAIPSVVVGVNLITDTPSSAVSVGAAAPSLTSSSEELAYGGDAYTGIQNAAAETERAVVDGFNQLGSFELELQRSVAQQQAKRAAASQAHVEDGLGWLLISLAVLNITVAVGRLTSGRVVA